MLFYYPSFWRVPRLRCEVPSASVAVGAERERFLFYDGAANVPAPAIPAWDDDKREALRAELVAQGLSEPEAESLIKTWHRELFDAQGLRVLTFLPRWLYDAAVPITIFPKPTALVPGA